jgi:hypothetical protein
MSQQAMTHLTPTRIEHDKQLDVFIAHWQEITHPLETEVTPLFDGNILFKIDAVTGELVQIFIYDFSSLRRQLLKRMIFLYTKTMITNWLEVLIAGFQVGRQSLLLAR